MARLRRLTPARSFQPKSDPIRLLAERDEPKIKAAMKVALGRLKTLVPVKAIEAAITSGQGNKAQHLVDWKSVARVLKTPIGLIAETFEAAGKHGGSQIDSGLQKRPKRRLKYLTTKLRKDREVEAIIGDDIESDADAAFAFDRFSASTQEKLRGLIDDMITDLSDKARATINSVVISGLRAGDSAEDIAANIRDTITLAPSQAEHVASYRRALEDLNPDALNRALRDSEHDAMIEDAIDSGEFLTDDQIDMAVNSYLDNYLDYRAQSIARTESLRAANAGLRDSYQQADEDGTIPSEAVTRHWQLDLDERTCPVCISIAENNPDGVGLGEDFQSDDGAVDDPPIHTNCRCTVQYVTNLDLVSDQEE